MALCEQQEPNLPDNNMMPISTDTADWNSFGRANASQKWRVQSAAMGNDMTQAIVEAATIGTVLRMLPNAAMPESGRKVFALADENKLTQALYQAGFSQAKEELVTVPWIWLGAPEEVWEYFQDVAVPFASLLQSIPADRRPEINTAVLKAIGQYYEA